ncbi:MAG: DUF4270 family protein [Bacteroidales bacterium]|nr:DUF4270 family protein [Bacteroidales bacterium]
MNLLKKINLGVSAILLLAYLLPSCNNDNLILGENFIDNTTRIVEVDTFSMVLSTIIVDSVKTSSTGTILSGCYEDGEFGNLSAKGFFRIGLPISDDVRVEESDVFDSLILVLPYSKYTYGDTNQIQRIDIYKLKEKLVRDDISDYYNSSDLETYDYSIGSLDYYPRPHRDSVIEIRLDDSMGEDLFEKMKNNTEELSSYEEFLDYLYGFAIIPDNSKNSAIVGFKSLELRFNLYTSRIKEEKEEIVYEFPSSDSQYHFSCLVSDRSGTVLEGLITQKNELNSKSADNKSYIQAGTGVLTKITFPYLNSILFDEKDIITSVELILKPDNESYKTDLPELISVYGTNKFNEFDLEDDESFISYCEFNLDEQYHLDTYYSFNITDFIQEQLDEGFIDSDKGLLLTLPSPYFNTSLERLILSTSSDPERAPRLKITYLEF